MKKITTSRTCLLFFMAAATFPAVGSAQQLASLADFSLEELSDIVVTSVSRRQERVIDAAASVFVISSNDIRRSGATSLPEALRLAPNLQVARIDASQYAITARGGNSTTANKLLVLIDGRTVYTPLYSGVFWDAQHVMLEDVERIEVISGPGATLWGANAVNGVINVITRNARDTQGTLVSVEAGNLERSIAVRQGGQLGADGHYRIFGKTFDRSNSYRANGGPIRDDAQNGQAGFRADWGTGRNGMTLQGDIYQGKTEQAPTGERDLSGANLLARWKRELDDGSELTFQTYFDRTKRTHDTVFSETLDTIDLEFQHGLPSMSGHKILWGAGYRHSRDRVDNLGPTLAFMPADRSLNYSHAFIQDQVAFNAKLDVTMGLKLETNPYTDLEYLPSLRMAYKYDDNNLLWGSLSRSVRAPSRLDRELFAPAVAPYTSLAGGPEFKSEIANVLEVGYRAQPSKIFSYSVTAFHHRYDRLRSVEIRPAGPTLENSIEGKTTGIEAWGTYQVSDSWRLSGGFTEMNIKRERPAGSPSDGRDLRALGNDPERTLLLRSSVNLTERHELDLTLRHVDDLPDPAVPAYTAVDGRLGWHPTEDMEVSLIVRNMFDERHAEFGAAPNRAELERSVMLRLLWRL